MSNIKKNKSTIHPKITTSIETMHTAIKYNLEYYAEMALYMNFYECDDNSHIKTAGINCTKNGINFYYNKTFFDKLNQKQVNFVVLHEIFHVLFRHTKRCLNGGYNHTYSNYAQDMIINTILYKDVDHNFIEIPTNDVGKNTALFIDKGYTQEWIFEILYNDLIQIKNDTDKKRLNDEDNKFFDELYFNKNLPRNDENILISNTLEIRSSLINFSKKQFDKYFNNFVRYCILNIKNNKTIIFYGNKSSVEDDIISYNRALYLKQAVIDNIQKNIELYTYSMLLIKYDNKNKDQRISYILQKEHLTNDILINQRKKELDTEYNDIYEQYLLTELSKSNILDLKNMVKLYTNEKPNISNEIEYYKKTADELIKIEDKLFNNSIVLNDDDNFESKINTNNPKYNKYQIYNKLTDVNIKQQLNQRFEYLFEKNNGNSDGYGENGINGEMCYDLNHIFNNPDEQFDTHIPDEISDAMKEQMLKDIHTRFLSKNRGHCPGNIQSTLDKLTKKRKDYTKSIRGGVSFVKGHSKRRSMSMPNRRNIPGLAGKRKYLDVINVILDVSGSMHGYFEKVLSLIFRSDLQINLIQADTIVQKCIKIKSKNELQRMSLTGLGGTVLQPAIDYVVDKFNNTNTIVLSDGVCDSLDLSKLHGKVLLITCQKDIPVAVSNGKVRHINIQE